MKQILLLIIFGLLFSQSEIDTTKKIPVFDLSKGFNIPGIIPKTLQMKKQTTLYPHEIERCSQPAEFSWLDLGQKSSFQSIYSLN